MSWELWVMYGLLALVFGGSALSQYMVFRQPPFTNEDDAKW